MQHSSNCLASGCRQYPCLSQTLAQYAYAATVASCATTALSIHAPHGRVTTVSSAFAHLQLTQLLPGSVHASCCSSGGQCRIHAVLELLPNTADQGVTLCSLLCGWRAVLAAGRGSSSWVEVAEATHGGKEGLGGAVNLVQALRGHQRLQPAQQAEMEVSVCLHYTNTPA